MASGGPAPLGGCRKTAGPLRPWPSMSLFPDEGGQSLLIELPGGKPGMWWHGSPESLSQIKEGSSNHFLEQVAIVTKHLRVPHLRLWAQAQSGISEVQVRNWRDSPMVKSTYCSYRGCGFCFQHSSHVTQNCLSLQFQGIWSLGT